MAQRFAREQMQKGMETLEQALQMPWPEFRAFVRRGLQRCGTDVTQNDNDLYGDGDQSRIPAENKAHEQFYRDLFAIGGDINHLADLGMAPLSSFAKQCITGNVDGVQRALQEAASESGSPQRLLRLLETRETVLRLSPLLMVVSIGKNVGGLPGSSMNDTSQRQIQVAKLLLEYGARTDARDVCGKTVCHYGMGAMATPMTMTAASLCIQAHQSSHFIGQTVELVGMSEPGRNGGVGICKVGYLSDSGCRKVYLTEQNETVLVKPENMKLVDAETSAASATKLCDIPDRLGAVCLLEVIQGNRADVAKVLLEDHVAALNIADNDGVSPRSISINTGLMSPVAAMVNQEVGRRARKDRKGAAQKCANCGKPSSGMVCSQCKSVVYCSKECQKQHWKTGGHKKQCVAKNSHSVVLERPKGGMSTTTFNFHSFQNQGRKPNIHKEGDGYKKPSNVSVGELFYLKVQGGGPQMPLMLYDKTRECEFSVSPGDRGFEELRKAVNDEPTWQGRKTYVRASFDKNGHCTVYPKLTSIKAHW